ncbi:hypothetical protein ACUS6K_30845, partial [Pseudomonas aeruginosa]
GLLALAGVLGIGEGHLLHQKTRWGGVRLFCQNQKVFFRLSLEECLESDTPDDEFRRRVIAWHQTLLSSSLEPPK